MCCKIQIIIHPACMHVHWQVHAFSIIACACACACGFLHVWLYFAFEVGAPMVGMLLDLGLKYTKVYFLVSCYVYILAHFLT